MLKRRASSGAISLVLALLFCPVGAASAQGAVSAWRVNGVPLAMQKFSTAVSIEQLGAAIESRWKRESGSQTVLSQREQDRWTFSRQRGLRHESLVLKRLTGSTGTQVLVLATHGAPRMHESGGSPPAQFGRGWRLLSVLEPLVEGRSTGERQWMLRSGRAPVAASARLLQSLTDHGWQVSYRELRTLRLIEANHHHGFRLLGALSPIDGGSLAFISLRGPEGEKP